MLNFLDRWFECVNIPSKLELHCYNSHATITESWSVSSGDKCNGSLYDLWKLIRFWGTNIMDVDRTRAIEKKEGKRDRNE